MAKKRPQKRRLNPQFLKFSGIVVLIILIILLLTSGPRGTLKLYKSDRDKEQLQQDIEALESRKAQLDSERTLLQNDPAYIEKVAREKYNMKKKGEKVYRVESEGSQ